MREPGQPSRLGAEDIVDHDDTWVRFVLRDHAPAVSALLQARYPILTAEDVEDIVILAMVRLWKARDRFDAAKASLRTYFCRIADNVARSVIQSGWIKARKLEVTLDERQIAPPMDCGLQGVAPQNAGMVQALRQALDRLPEAYRAIVLADACAQGRVASAEFLAQELQIPVGTVRVYRHRAMNAIRVSLEEAGYK